MDACVPEQIVQRVCDELLKRVEKGEQKVIAALAGCIKRSELKKVFDDLNQQINRLAKDVNANPLERTPNERFVLVIKEIFQELVSAMAVQAIKIERLFEQCDANAMGISTVGSSLDHVETKTEITTTKVELFKRDVQRLSEEMARPSLPFCLTRFSGNDLEVMSEGVKALKQWSGKAKATLVYDSKTEPITADELFNRVKGRKNVTIVCFTTDGDVFGGFYSVAVNKQDVTHDPTIFVFSFESRGRCMTPQRFVVKRHQRETVQVRFYAHDRDDWFVKFGGNQYGRFGLGSESSRTWCEGLSNMFEGLDDTTLTGKTGKQFRYKCKRLVAFYLE